MDEEHDARALAFARVAQRSAAPGRLVTAAGGLDPVRLTDPEICHSAHWSPEAAGELLAAADDERETARRWRAAGWRLIAFGDPAYPPLLYTIADPPPVLFVRGRVELLGEPQIAMVGTRKPSADGRAAACMLARELAGRGFRVTSGLALGIDGAAHEGALEAGTTLAVLGSGPDRVYPARHRALAQRIGDSGALITEFPPGAPPRAHHFPRRNRIISGLSLATLVVEAAPRSGSLITARLAGEQGREVLAVPGSIHNRQSRGCHDLLRDGAWLVASAEDVQAALTPMRCLARAVDPQPAATEPADPVLAAFTGGVNSLDELAERTGMDGAEMSQRLTDLELRGLVERSPGGYQVLAPEQ